MARATNLPFRAKFLTIKHLQFLLYLIVEQDGGEKPKWWPDNIKFEHPFEPNSRFEILAIIRNFYELNKDKKAWLRELATYIKINHSDDTEDDVSNNEEENITGVEEENTIEEEENTIEEEENTIDEEENIIHQVNGNTVENLNNSISQNNPSNLKSSDYNIKDVKLSNNKNESPDNNTKKLASSINETESVNNNKIDLTLSTESSDSSIEDLSISIKESNSSDLKLSIKESELKQLMPTATVQLYDVVRYGTNENKEDFLLTLNLMKNDTLSKLNLLKYRKRLRKTGQVPRSSLTIKKDLQRFKNKSTKTTLKELTSINDQHNKSDKLVTTNENRSENGTNSSKFYNLSSKSFNETNKENDISNLDESSQSLINNSVSPTKIKKSKNKSSELSNVQTLSKNISIQENTPGRVHCKNTGRFIKLNETSDSSTKENISSKKDLKNISPKNKNNSEILKQPVSSTPIKSATTLSIHQVVSDLNSDLSEKAETGKKEDKKLSLHQKKERRKSISMNTSTLDLNLSKIESIQTENDKMKITPDKSNKTLQSSPDQEKKKSFHLHQSKSKSGSPYNNLMVYNEKRMKGKKRLSNSPKKLDSKSQNFIKKYFSPTKKFSSPQQLKLKSLKELCKPCFVVLETTDKINRPINQVSQVIRLKNDDIRNVEPISKSSVTEIISQTKIIKSNIKKIASNVESISNNSISETISPTKIIKTNDKGIVSNVKEIDENTTIELIDLIDHKKKFKAKAGRYSDSALFKKQYSKQKKTYSLRTKKIKKNKRIKIKWPSKLLNLTH